MMGDNKIEKKPKKISTGHKVQTEVTTVDKEIILKVDVKINRIYFISDIHIKNKDNNDHIYYHVFDNLFEKLEKEKINENDLVVVLGDILDDGRDITSSGFKLLEYLYKGISKHCETISILGNHDLRGIEMNEKKDDLITPLINNLNLSCNKFNHFLLDNKIYLYGNVAFGHTKFIANTVTDCVKYNEKYITIGLFHGSINGSKFDNNQVVSGQQFSMKNFKDYQYVACGDLHTQQWLRKDHTAFYPSSLLQHKVNEGLDHGMVKLDLNTCLCEFMKIKNKYKIIDLKLDDKGNIVNYDFNKYDDTEYANLQISYGKHDDKMIENVKKQFYDNGIIVTDFKRKPNFGLLKVDSCVEIGEKKYNLIDVKTKNDLIDFLNVYIFEKHKIDDKEKFKQYNKELINDALSNDDLLTEKNINIMNIKINNLMIYGENSNLNVDKIDGILGVCQSNSYGKSSLCESISLIFCGVTPRCSCAKSFIRKGEQIGYGTVTFKINDVLYEITRTFKLHGKHALTNADVTLELKKIINVKTYESINYTSDKRHAEKYISYVYTPLKELQLMVDELLTYDEIYSMLIVSQDREKSFLKTKDKVGILFKVTNLGYIDKITQKCLSELTQLRKNITMTIKKYIPEDLLVGFFSKNGDTGIKYIEHIRNKIDEFSVQLSDTSIDDDYYDVLDDYDTLKKEIIKYEETLKFYKEFSNVTTNVNQIKKTILDFQNELKQNENEINLKMEEQNKLNLKLCEFEKKIKEFGDIDVKQILFNDDKQKTLDKNKATIAKLKKQLKYCDDIKLKDYTSAQIELNKCNVELEKISLSLNSLEKKIILYADTKKIFNDYKEYLNYECEFLACVKFIELCEKIKTKDKSIFSELHNVKLQRNMLEQKIAEQINFKNAYDEYNPNVDLIKERTILYETQNMLNNSIKKYKQVIHNYETQKENINIYNEIEILENKNTLISNARLEKYDEYLEFINKKKLIDYEIKNLNNIVDKLKNKNDKLNNFIEKEQHTLEIIENNIEKYNVYNEIKNEYNSCLKYFQHLKIKFEKMQKQKNENDTKNKKIENQILIAKNILEKCLNDVDKLNCYEIINNSLKNNGLYDMLIEKIVSNLQNAIDQMTEFIGHEKINVNLIKGSKYDIVINTEKIPDIVNAGGFQSKIMELLFKMAFLKINSYFKSDFIVIDEIYDACSEENKPMAIKLVDFFKLNYKKMMVVSHNPSIIDLFDSRLTIKYDVVNGNTLIMKK